MGELNMKAVLRITGISADRLRIWEKRYGAVKPIRSKNGRRVYSDHETQRLKLLLALVDQGHSIGTIANLPDEELLVRISGSKNLSHNFQLEYAELIESLARFDLARIGIQLGRLRFLVSPREFVLEVIPNVLMLVGKKIEEGAFSVSQEHAMSEIFQGHLKRIYDDLAILEDVQLNQETYLFCTREGDPHDFGLQMAAIIFRSLGIKTHYLGKSLPADDLVMAVQKMSPKAVVIGMTAVLKKEEKISPQKFLKEIDSKLNRNIELWIGGSAVADLKRTDSLRLVYIFESIKELEEKLRVMVPVLKRS